MSNISRKNNNRWFSIGMIFAAWFAFTGMYWSYAFCLVYGYPFGILSLLIWLKIRQDKDPYNTYIPMTLLIGLAVSLTVLMGILFLPVLLPYLKTLLAVTAIVAFVLLLAYLIAK